MKQLPSPSPSPASAASLPLTPLRTLFDDSPCTLTVNYTQVTPTKTPAAHREYPDTLQRFSNLCVEDQFDEVFNMVKPSPEPQSSPTRLNVLPATALPTSLRLAEAPCDPYPPLTEGMIRSFTQHQQTPKKSSVVRVESLKAQVGVTTPYTKPRPTLTKTQGEAVKWPTPRAATDFVPSGRVFPPLRKKRVPSGPRALQGMSSDEWLRKKNEVKQDAATGSKARTGLKNQTSEVSRRHVQYIPTDVLQMPIRKQEPVTPLTGEGQPTRSETHFVSGFERILNQESHVLSSELTLESKRMSKPSQDFLPGSTDRADPICQWSRREDESCTQSFSYRPSLRSIPLSVFLRPGPACLEILVVSAYCRCRKVVVPCISTW